MKNLINISDKLNSIHEEINAFNSDERKEIKKNNKIIDTYISELDNIKNIIYEEISSRYEELIPVNKELMLDLEAEKVAFEKIKFLSLGDYIYKLDINKNLYEIRYGNSLDKINVNVKDLFDKFLSIGVELSKEDFKYSLSLYKYMSVYFDNMEHDDFDVKLKDIFDSLYWECPEIVNHIYLCFMLLLEKYKDKFEVYIKNKYSEIGGYEEELDNFYKLVMIKDDKLYDEYVIYEKFSNGELRIEDYLDDSVVKKDVISKFIDYDKYISLSKDDRVKFYNQIKNIYYDLCEYLWINKYNYMISKVKEIYLNKGNYLNNYTTLLKNLKVLNKQRVQLNNKLFTIYDRIKSKGNNRLLKKYNSLFNKANVKINEIINSYGNYDEVVFVNDIISKLNDDSTYYDVFKLFESNYCYLVDFMKDKDDVYNNFIEYLYSPYLNISKIIPFMSDVNIEDKLIEKYDLFDIDINFSDKLKLKEDLEYIIMIGNLEINDIDVSKFKLIFDIKKILE